MSAFSLKGLVGHFLSGGHADGTQTTARFDTHNALVLSQLRGQYSELCQRGKVFSAHVSGVTIPVIDADLASVFGLYNPPDSGVDIEIIETEISQVLAATVVNSWAWWFSTAAESLLATFTTPGTIQCNRIGNPAAAKARFYSAVTHSGTPTRIEGIGQDGATANATSEPRRKHHKGTLIIPPGILASVAASTAAGTASGLAIDMKWTELPIVR